MAEKADNRCSTSGPRLRKCRYGVARVRLIKGAKWAASMMVVPLIFNIARDEVKLVSTTGRVSLWRLLTYAVASGVVSHSGVA